VRLQVIFRQSIDLLDELLPDRSRLLRIELSRGRWGGWVPDPELACSDRLRLNAGSESKPSVYGLVALWLVVGEVGRIEIILAGDGRTR
jgi:hypothetical protein